MNDVNILIQDMLDNPPTDGIWLSSLNLFIDGLGKRMSGMHSPLQCEGRGCPIHAPSDHPLRHLKLSYRYSDIGLEPIIAERVCEHGVGHPDPDFLQFIEERHGAEARRTLSTHGCDGCCGNLPAVDRADAARAIEAEARITADADKRPLLDPPSPEARIAGWEATTDGEVTT